jgi:hypothetical protein
MTGTVAAIGVSLVIIAVVTWVIKRRSPARSNDARHAAGRPAVHLPSEDPYWLEYSQRQTQRPRRGQRRRKIWAAGTAGAVGTGSTDPGGGCGGGSSCGGGCGGDG